MKIAVLADVHANLPALESVLAAADEAGADRTICLGDMVGYYYWPAECLRLLVARNTWMIQGNHDALLVSAERDAKILADLTQRYGSGHRTALAELGADELALLRDLPTDQIATFDGVSVLLCHGSPWDRDTYVYPDTDGPVRRRMLDSAPVVLFGHTHYPTLWRDGDRFAANPGSVGQPRHGKPGAHWAMWDTDDGSFELLCESYDTASVVQACQKNDPNLPYLADVLERTRKQDG
jgi:putative phosphoesterase